MGITGKIYPMTKIKKTQMYMAIYDKKEKIFNIDMVKKHIANCLDNGLTVFTDIFSGINLIHFLNCNSEIDEYFDCLFIKGNVAWVSKDKSNHYRYFTRSGVGITFSLDFIDLFSVYLNAGFRKTIKTIDNMFGIAFTDEWKIHQTQKYRTNKFLLEDKQLLQKYPNIYSLIKKHINILQIINEIGDVNLIGKSLKFNNEAVFFSSTRHIKENYNTMYSTSTINQVINVFAVLGLINKVSDRYIPKEYICLAKSRMKIDKCRYNHVSFYTIPNLLDGLDRAEERAIILNKNSIKYYTMTQYVVRKIFGESFASDIYVQKVYGGRGKLKTKILKDEKELIRHLFNVSVIDNGFASKEILKKATEMSEKPFNQFWIELTKTINHTAVKPNKRMKEKLKLLTNENVIIINEIYKRVSF